MAERATSSMIAESAKVRVGSLPAQVLTDAAPDGRQSLGQPGEPARLAELAHPLPLGVVAILQPTGGVAPDCLNVCPWVFSVEHTFVSRRHRQRRESLRLHAAHRFAIRRGIAKAAAMGEPAYPQFTRRDIVEAKPFDEFGSGERDSGSASGHVGLRPAPRLFGPLRTYQYLSGAIASRGIGSIGMAHPHISGDTGDLKPRPGSLARKINRLCGKIVGPSLRAIATQFSRKSAEDGIHFSR
jgi:hypothetical protein